MFKYGNVEISRHYTATDLNKVANDPSVYDWVRGNFEGYMDFTPIVANPNNYLLMGEHGGVLLIWMQPGLYEAHVQVLPEGRGKWAVEMCRAGLHWMFTRTDAIEISTRVPVGNIPALALTRRTGGMLEFRREQGWTVNGKTVPADVYSFKVHDWIRTAPKLAARGHWFHDRLEQEFKRHNKKHGVHPDWDVHDQNVGAAVEMILGGQPQKGQVFYNRWAQMAGYEPFEIITHNPLTLDIKEAILAVRNNDFWIMACR